MGFDGLLVRILVDLQAGAKLAVDLHHQLHARLHECGLIIIRPLGFTEHAASTESRVEFFAQMRGEGVEHGQKLRELRLGNDLGIRERIGADHHLRDRGVEAELLDVFTDFLDGFVHHSLELFVGAFLRLRRILNLGRNFTFIGYGHAPDPGQEAGHAFHTFHLPGLHLFERAHEHFIEAQRIGAVVLHDVVGVDDVAA